MTVATPSTSRNPSKAIPKGEDLAAIITVANLLLLNGDRLRSNTFLTDRQGNIRLPKGENSGWPELHKLFEANQRSEHPRTTEQMVAVFCGSSPRIDKRAVFDEKGRFMKQLLEVGKGDSLWAETEE